MCSSQRASGERIFYFLHIPKTAGTTFNFSVLPKLFNASEICPAYSYRQILQIPPAELSKFHLFRGHFFYFLHKLLPDKPIYMTFLRDPVERALSLYDYVRREPKHSRYELVRSLSGGIRDFVRSRQLLVPDFQVTAIACDIDPLKAVEDARLRESRDIDEDGAIIGQMISRPATHEDLVVARERLEGFPFVGITERFEESLQLLCHTFGWGPPPAFESLNVAPETRVQREQLPPDIVDEITETHQLDFELYEFARTLFSKRLGQIQPHATRV